MQDASVCRPLSTVYKTLLCAQLTKAYCGVETSCNRVDNDSSMECSRSVNLLHTYTQWVYIETPVHMVSWAVIAMFYSSVTLSRGVAETESQLECRTFAKFIS